MKFQCKLLVLLSLGLGVAACAEQHSEPGPEEEAPLRPPRMVVSDVEFKSAPIGVSTTTRVVVRNEGERVLEVDEIRIDGDAFGFDGQDPYAGAYVAIDGGDSFEFSLEFTRTSSEDVVGSLVITVIDPDDEWERIEEVVPIHVAPCSPRLYLSPDTVQLGKVPAGDRAEATILAANIGCQVIEVYDVLVLGGNDAVTVTRDGLSAWGFTIRADEFVELVVNYEPRVYEPLRASLIFRSNGTGSATGHGDDTIDVVANGAVP